MASGDVNIAYGSSSAVTITLASLATDSNLLTGRESTAVSNTSTKAIDYLVGGKITTGTSPTSSKQIEVWCVASFNDTPTYPDVFDGTDSAETVTSADIKYLALKRIAIIPTDSTSDRTYPIPLTGIAQLFGGSVPKNFGFFVTHNTGVNFNSTSGNHEITVTPIYATVTP